jgi:hypothetical protein
MLTFPITKKSKQHEWKTILEIARKNRFPAHIIHNLENKLKNKRQQQQQNLITPAPQQNKKWIVFTY